MMPFQNLQSAVEIRNEPEIINNLRNLSSQEKEINESNKLILKNLLQIKNDEILSLTVENISEWAKNDQNRNILCDVEIINQLLPLMLHDNLDIALNTIRSLGNISYNNQKACELINKDGFEKALLLLDKDNDRKDNRLTTKACGFIQNLLTLDDLIRAALKSRLLETIERLLNKYSITKEDNCELIGYLLTTLSSISEYLEEQKLVFKDSLYQKLVDIFKSTNQPELSVTCLEIFHTLAEKDEVKVILANGGICEVLIQNIEKYRDQVNDEDTRAILKMACDLIVIILTEDSCMYLLYNNGNGKVYKEMIKWLESSDVDLLGSGILAVGNFARKENHCIQMVQNGVSKKLISLLSKYNSTNSDVKIQHALLSTLKNLVIAKPNKPIVLKEGLIDVIYPMIESSHQMVIFKLLGTFRMVTDGQENTALDLISRKEFIEKLVHWSTKSDHPGIAGEVPRLLVWLIKNCHSFKPFSNLLSVENSIKCVVDMIKSNHAVMQNEAIFALQLLCIGCSTDLNMESVNYNEKDNTWQSEQSHKLAKELIKAEIGQSMHFFLNKYGEKMDKHSIDNLLTLLDHFTDSKEITAHFREYKVDEALKKLLGNDNAENCVAKINKLVSGLESA